MNGNTRQRLIDQVIWGYTPATVLARDGRSIPLLLHPPTSKEQAKSAIIYASEYESAIALGLSDEDTTIADMIVIGRWSEKQDEEISGLQDDIHKLRRGILDYVFDKGKLEKVRALLRRAEFALLERLSNRHDLLENGAEAHALLCQQRYLVGCITENEDGTLFWKSEKDFQDFEDIGIVTQLCEVFFRKSHLSIKNIREIARSQQWRVYWEIAKETNDLFDGPVSLWSYNQRELAYWSTIYDSVHEAYERPSRDIVVDDDLLDSWFIRQGEKSETKTQENISPQSNKPGMNEQFIMADKEGAKEVYKMNDPGSRIRIKARQKALKEKGSVKEQHMPDSQREIRKQLIDMQSKHVKNIGSR